MNWSGVRVPPDPPVGMAELVDAPGLGSGVLWRGGSSPLTDTRSNSSAVEQHLYTVNVGGSIPSSSITHMRLNAYKCYLHHWATFHLDCLLQLPYNMWNRKSFYFPYRNESMGTFWSTCVQTFFHFYCVHNWTQSVVDSEHLDGAHHYLEKKDCDMC